MKKLHQLLSPNVFDFAIAFGAATDDLSGNCTPPGLSLWLEGWPVAACAGYVLGDGKFMHDGQARRFHFSGLPLRQGSTARLCASGSVSCLRRGSDFDGFYLFCESRPTWVQGRTTARLQNQHGVMIDLIAPYGDRPFDLPHGGLRMRVAEG